MPFPSRPRVSDAYAESRIREKLAAIPAKPRQGLSKVSHDLKEAGVSPSARLHLVSAIADLGKLADATRRDRIARATSMPLREAEFPKHWRDLSYKD